MHALEVIGEVCGVFLVLKEYDFVVWSFCLVDCWSGSSMWVIIEFWLLVARLLVVLRLSKEIEDLEVQKAVATAAYMR